MAQVFGFAGWSGAGKTTLIRKIIGHLVQRGLRVSTIKHAHHDFDIDQPGKDSWEHREAGATEVLIASDRRWALMRELRGAAEPSLATLLGKLGPADLVLVEGFKREAIPKMEVFRAEAGKPPLHPEDRAIIALASDTAFPASGLPLFALDAIDEIARFVHEHAARF